MKRMYRFLLPASLAWLLAACGGGSDELPVVAADPLAELPAGASQSASAMTGYLGTLASLPADSREPLVVDNFNPPKPDDAEPEPAGV